MTKKDLHIVERIRQGDESALDYLYKKHHKMMISMVVRNNGSRDEALDIYQDALIVFWQKCQEKNFELRSKISTYLYSICQNLWLKELDRKSKFSDNAYKEEGEENNFDQDERSRIVRACIEELGESCKNVLTYYYFDGLSMEQIADKMGLANSDTAKTKRYKCKKRLDDLIRSRYTASDFLD